MAANIYTPTISYSTPKNYSSEDIAATIFYSNPYPSEVTTGTSYLNRVWDTAVAGTDKTHYWTTSNTPDDSGAFYDGPGTWGVTTSDYCVEAEYGS